jgi:hypothetical protein
MKKKLFAVLAAVLALIAVPAFADYLNETYFGVKDLYIGEDGSLTFEGATDDGYESIFVITDPTADRTITFPNSSGTVALNPAAASWEFEGATADTYETTLTVVDPTADRTVTIPNATGAVILSAGGVAESANAISGGSGTLVFEGSTADAYETTLTAADTTSSDKTITLPNATGTVALTDSTITPPSVNINSGGAVTFLAKGQLTVVNTDTDTTTSVIGALTTDYVVATINDGNSNGVFVETAVVSSAGVVTVTLSGDPGADTKVSYIVIR